MIKLNLLPPDEKKTIAAQINLRKIIIWGSTSLVLILIFLVLLSSLWFFLLIQLKSADSIFKELEASSQGKTFQEFEKETEEINEKLRFLDKLQGQIENHSLALQELTELVPSGVTFKEISVNKNKVVLQGHAIDRDILISFKEALETSSYFEEINSPLSNFLKQRDINFSFSFQIKSQ